MGRRLLPIALGAPAAMALIALLSPLLPLFLAGPSRLNAVFAEPYYRGIFLFTYGQAFLSTLLAGLLGVAGALWLDAVRSKWLRRLEAASLVTVSLPPIVLAFGLIAVFGRHGWIGGALGSESPFFGFGPLLVAHVAFNTPLFLRFAGLALRASDPMPEMAARSLGANSWITAWRVTLPRLAAPIASASGLSFLYCSTSFVLPLLLGGSPRFATTEVAIYEAAHWGQDEAIAGCLALVHFAVAVLVLTSAGFLGRRNELHDAGSERGLSAYRPEDSLARWLGPIFLIALLLLLFLPLTAVLGRGVFALGRFEGGRDLLWASWESLERAFACAGLAVPMAVGLAYGAARLRWFARGSDVLAAIPLAASPLLLAVALAAFLRKVGADPASTIWPVAVVQALSVQPVLFPLLRTAFARVNRTSIWSAMSLGAGPWEVLKSVELASAAPAIRSALLIAASFSLGEVGSLLMFEDTAEPTLALLLFRWMGRYRFDDANVVAALLVLVVAVACFWAERQRRWA